MIRLERRLKRLKAVITDDRGLISALAKVVGLLDGTSRADRVERRAGGSWMYPAGGY
jgi:hypothetical protein